jgi:hypothetical protein
MLMKSTRTTKPKQNKKWYKPLLKSIPDPKVRLREGSGKVLAQYMLLPLTELQIEVPTLLETEHLIKHRKNDLQKLRTHKFKTYKLYSKRGRK